MIELKITIEEKAHGTGTATSVQMQGRGDKPTRKESAMATMLVEKMKVAVVEEGKRIGASAIVEVDAIKGAKTLRK